MGNYFKKSIEKMKNMTDDDKYIYIMDVLKDIRTIALEGNKEDDWVNKLEDAIRVVDFGMKYFYHMYKYDEDVLDHNGYLDCCKLLNDYDIYVKEGKTDTDIAKEYGKSIKEFREIISAAKKLVDDYRIKVCNEYLNHINYGTVEEVAEKLDIPESSVLNYFKRIHISREE